MDDLFRQSWHVKRKKFRALGMESMMWTEGCVFFDGRGIQRGWTNSQAGNEMKWRSGNERQLSSFHHANRGKVSEHYIGEIKIS